MSKENLVGYLGKATSVGQEVIFRLTAPQPFSLHTSTAVNETWQGATGVSLAQITVLAGAQNVGRVQLSLYAVVGASNYLELYAQDSFELGGINLDDIHLKFANSGDTVYFAYSLADGDLANMETV